MTRVNQTLHIFFKLLYLINPTIPLSQGSIFTEEPPRNSCGQIAYGRIQSPVCELVYQPEARVE